MLYLALGFMIPSDPVGLVLERMLHTKCCTPYITFNARAKLKKKQIKQDLVYTCIFGVVAFIELYAMV